MKPVSTRPDDGVGSFLRNASYHTQLCMASQRGRQKSSSCCCKMKRRIAVARRFYVTELQPSSGERHNGRRWPADWVSVAWRQLPIDFKVELAFSFETSLNSYPTNSIAFMKTARFIGQRSDCMRSVITSMWLTSQTAFELCLSDRTVGYLKKFVSIF
jgi:hypothetical protein